MSDTLTSPAHADTLVHLLHKRALEQPEQVAYTFLRYGEIGNTSLTYRELELHARCIGAALRIRGASGKPVLLFFSPGLAYIAAYFGCLYAGAIAVPAYAPHSARDLPRIQTIITDTQADIVLTTIEDYARVERWIHKTPDLAQLSWLTTDSLDYREESLWQDHAIDSTSLAFLQYTSGSTTTPKGVMVSHGNLMHNLAAIHASWNVEGVRNPVAVYWLPIFHDMGLIMGILAPLYSGYPLYFMAPADFLQRPIRWLQAISDYRGTFSGAPNFAYELCLRRIAPEDRAQLDLSCWQGTANAAETVRSDTITRFARYFAVSGFSLAAVRPAYGLAEATLLVSSREHGDPLVIKTISKQTLEEGYLAEPTTPEQESYHIVSCGRSIQDQSILIVNPETRERCESTQVGEVWLAGPSVTHGYWRRPEETAEIFQAHLATGEGPFMRTGDLGVYQDQNLFITGRIKDLIIINGRNLYPQDLELTVEQSHPAIRAGHCVAFSDALEGEEHVIILAEINRHYRPESTFSAGTEEYSFNTQELVESIRQAVAEQHDVRAHHILLLKPGGILKTSSGKLQRHACKKAFLHDVLKAWNS
ncbi:acyl-CoA synthetase [Dictyobacter alpinus]|uniref:Acyl-CoA synthetase n=1 Tax=Dictyobacter alpinus TaxID=2014873 RepID=A0A402BD69_9CHLR|nr:fatty acyl-AMP ligase [Dictyobacter alpinus]GCE29305.1 acyl-CoA synthetase [Dictyobacter alpinus]